MSNKVFTLPKPVDEQGQPLSAEEIDEINQLPTIVPVELFINEKYVTFHVACDFDMVDRKADSEYQVFKTSQIRMVQGTGKKKKNSKFTNLKDNVNTPEEDEEDEAELGMEILDRIQASTDRQHEVFMKILFPNKDTLVLTESGVDEQNVILGSNVPGMPETKSDLIQWFDRGGKTAKETMESIIAAYDPTSPLVSMRDFTRAQEKQRRLDQQLEKVQTIAGNSIQDALQSIERESNQPDSTSIPSQETLMGHQLTPEQLQEVEQIRQNSLSDQQLLKLPLDTNQIQPSNQPSDSPLQEVGKSASGQESLPIPAA